MMSIVDRIARSTGFSVSYVQKLTRKAPHSYRYYKIPKKSGGTRDIYHPSAELKVLQLWVVDNILDFLPVHDCVYSYKKNVNVAMHAERHRKANFLVRLDIRNYFPSITYFDVRRLILSNAECIPLELLGNDVDVLCRLVCRADVKSKALALTIGAPSSPAISNAVLYCFDVDISEYCEALGVTYTRYADDLYFSTNEHGVLEAVARYVREKLVGMPWPKLKLNEDKTVFTSRKRRKVVTGITLTSDKKLSIGRGVKRQIRTQVFLYINNQLPPEEISRLRGRLSYYRSVEPEFLESLINKFGEDPIHRMLS